MDKFSEWLLERAQSFIYLLSFAKNRMSLEDKQTLLKRDVFLTLIQRYVHQSPRKEPVMPAQREESRYIVTIFCFSSISWKRYFSIVFFSDFLSLLQFLVIETFKTLFSIFPPTWPGQLLLFCLCWYALLSIAVETGREN